jgi:hypothetical protein
MVLFIIDPQGQRVGTRVNIKKMKQNKTKQKPRVKSYLANEDN